MTHEEQLIARFVTLFGEPKTDNVERFLEEFAKAIAGYAPDTLARAGDCVMREATFWPKPAEVRAHADRIARDKQTTQRFKDYKVEDDMPPPTPEQKAKSRALLDALFASWTPTHVTGEPSKNRDVSRDAFRKMQEASPNEKLHRRPLSRKDLAAGESAE